MSKKLVGIYSNPKPEDAAKIAEAFDSLRQHEQNISEGFEIVGIIDKDTTPEEIEAIMDKAADLAPDCCE